MAYRDPAVGKARDRERFQRRTAERIARGLCPRCGLCGIPHKPHDGNVLVMLNIAKNLQFSSKLTPDHIT